MPIIINYVRIPPRRNDEEQLFRWRYWLDGQPGVYGQAVTNGLHKLCRKLVAMGITGPAELKDKNGRVTATVAAVERMARWDLYECPEKGFYRKPYRPRPDQDAICQPTVRVPDDFSAWSAPDVPGPALGAENPRPVGVLAPVPAIPLAPNA